MLNGKFYTGLPPNMIDRGSGRNRMESHLFWPDDTKVDTAVESRIKRRNSVQLASSDKPLYEKQISLADDVDTRKRFTKEFSQSSIQFYDNLNENSVNSRRSKLRNSVGNKNMEITEKPTNTRLQMPDSIVSEGYTAAKKKQAYTSKIEFYDYANDKEEDSQTKHLNLRKPKMDMNDKREMELNSKNSPKLQIKRDVRSLSEEKELRKINNREVRAMERPNRNNMNDREENYLRSRRSVEPRMNNSPKRSLSNFVNNRRQGCSSEREIYREPLPLPYEKRQADYFDNYKGRDYRRNTEQPKIYEGERDYENFEDGSSYRGEREQPKRMIRNNIRRYYGDTDDRNYSQGYLSDREITSKMRDIHMKSPPSARKQYYPIEEYYDDEPQYNYCQHDQIKTPTTRGSSHQRMDFGDRQHNEIELPYKDYNNTPKRSTANKSAANNINSQFEHETEVFATSPPPPTSDTESSVSATKSKKHLLSSLCFNNGEIIGANDAAGSPTSSQQKRNARSSATQRVSVGLPD